MASIGVDDRLRRPLLYIDREELSVWMHSSRQVKKAWRELSPILIKRHGQRSVNMSVFAMGFLAGQLALKHSADNLPELIRKAVEKALGPLSEEMQNRSELFKVL